MEQYCAVVVTYFPDESCLENLEILCNRCDRLIIVDNTPMNGSDRFPKSQDTTVFKLGRNIGLAAGLNKGIEFGGRSGYENIFLFDQDSRQPARFFEDMLRFKSWADRLNKNFAFYVPDFYDRHSKSFATFPMLKPFTIKHRKCGQINSVPSDEALIAVTSGTLLKYSAYKRLGPLREDYFIDFIDNEYCLRAYKAGFKIAINCGVVLNHAIGRRSVRKWLGLTLKPNFHSPLRRYYIARNGVRTALDYGGLLPVYAGLIFCRLGHELLSVLLFEDRRIQKLKAMGRGVVHGFMGRMGPCPLTAMALDTSVKEG